MEKLNDLVYVSSVNLGNTCLQIYDLTTGALHKSFRGSCLGSNSLCFVGLSDYLISSQKDKPLLQAWAINQHDNLQMRLPVPGKVNVMAIDEANSEYCAIGICEKIYVYQLNCGQTIGVINCHYQAVSCLQFTSCGNYIASCGEDGFVYLWSLASLIDSLHKTDRPQVQPHYILGQHSDKVTGLGISEDGMRGILITCSLDHSAKIFELVTGRLRYNIIASTGLTALTCNSICSQIFLAGEKGKVWGINLLPHRNSQVIQIEDQGITCHDGSNIQHMKLSTAGDILVTGGMDGEVKVWSIVMSEKKHEKISFALRRVLHVGRGSITNLIIKRMDKECFNLANLCSYKVIVPFTNQSNVDILDAVVPVAVRREPDVFNPQEFIDLASTLLLEDEKDLEQSTQNEKKKKSKSDYHEENERRKKLANETDFLAHVQQIKMANEELYKISLKHLIGLEK